MKWGMKQRGYPTDVSDNEWAFVAPYLTLMTEDVPQRVYELREVLNSVTMKDRAVETIREHGGAATKVYLYLDHDTAGRELTAYLTKHLTRQEVLDRSELYTGYKDFNDYLQAMQTRAREG